MSCINSSRRYSLFHPSFVSAFVGSPKSKSTSVGRKYFGSTATTSSSTFKPEEQHVVVTGRYASDELIKLADLVTEMVEVKHPYQSGVKAQKGFEF